MDGKREKEIYKITLVGSIVNVLLLVFKFVAGVIGHSSAMIADAVHSLSDFVTDIIVIVFVRIAGKPVDSDHAYGHGKYETLASVIVGIFLGAVGIGLFWNGLEKTISFFKGEQLGMPNYWALAAAILSIVLKEWLYRYTVKSGKRLESAALAANAWHHRSDALTSIATLIGIAGAMLLGPKWVVLDPLAAVVVSVFIVKASFDLMKPGIDELLEKSLGKDDIDSISEIISNTQGVTGFHRLRTRHIGSRVAIDVHVKMPGEISLYQAHDVASVIERKLKEKYGADTYVGIHMEPQR